MFRDIVTIFRRLHFQVLNLIVRDFIGCIVKDIDCHFCAFGRREQIGRAGVVQILHCETRGQAFRFECAYIPSNQRRRRGRKWSGSSVCDSHSRTIIPSNERSLDHFRLVTLHKIIACIEGCCYIRHLHRCPFDRSSSWGWGRLWRGPRLANRCRLWGYRLWGYRLWSDRLGSYRLRSCRLWGSTSVEIWVEQSAFDRARLWHLSSMANLCSAKCSIVCYPLSTYSA